CFYRKLTATHGTNPAEILAFWCPRQSGNSETLQLLARLELGFEKPAVPLRIYHQFRNSSIGKIVSPIQFRSGAAFAHIKRGRIHGSRSATRDLFDDLVSAGQDRRRDHEAEFLGGLEVDDQVECRRLLHRQISRLGPLENSSRVTTGLAKAIGDLHAIADQAAG